MRAGALVLLALALPLAAAETPFGIADASLDAMPPAANAWADVVAGSAEVVDDAVVMTLSFSALPEPHPGLAYIFLFDTDAGESWFAGAGTIPTLTFAMGRWTDGPATFEETTGSLTTGIGGAVVVEAPIAALGNATMLLAPRAVVLDIKGDALPVGGPVLELDAAEGAGTLALPPRAKATASADAAPTPEPQGGDPEPASAGEAPAATAPADDERATVPLPLAAALAALALARARRRSR